MVSKRRHYSAGEAGESIKPGAQAQESRQSPRSGRQTLLQVPFIIFNAVRLQELKEFVAERYFRVMMLLLRDIATDFINISSDSR
jgi:hypothetical protein